jgi:DNA invertase Pin-like site-specific DNA recombinase
MKIGYARVSTKDQNLDSQIKKLNEYGCQRIFKDKLSGKSSDRVGLQEALEFIREGDTLVVFKMDRLSRSIRDLISIVSKIQERGAEFTSLTEKIDTSSAGGKLIFHIFGALSQFERELIVERTKLGLEAANEQGRFGGRPKRIKQSDLEIISKMRSAGISVKKISEQLEIPRSTIYRYLGNSL